MFSGLPFRVAFAPEAERTNRGVTARGARCGAWDFWLDRGRRLRGRSWGAAAACCLSFLRRFLARGSGPMIATRAARSSISASCCGCSAIRSRERSRASWPLTASSYHRVQWPSKREAGMHAAVFPGWSKRILAAQPAAADARWGYGRASRRPRTHRAARSRSVSVQLAASESFSMKRMASGARLRSSVTGSST